MTHGNWESVVLANVSNDIYHYSVSQCFKISSLSRLSCNTGVLQEISVFLLSVNSVTKNSDLTEFKDGNC